MHPLDPAAQSAPTPPLRGRLVSAAAVLLGVGVLAALAFTGAYPCPTARVFHFPCPGCGLTRATLAVLRGDLTRAFALHPMVFVVLPLLAASLSTLLLAAAAPELSRRRWVVTLERVASWGWVAAALLMFVLWGLRFAGAFGGPVPIE